MNKTFIFADEKAVKAAKAAAQRFEAENPECVCVITSGSTPEGLKKLADGENLDLVLLGTDMDALMGRYIDGYHVWGLMTEEEDTPVSYAAATPTASANKEKAKVFAKLFLANRFHFYGFAPAEKSVGSWDIKPANMWDDESRYYSIMTLMEINGTNLQLDAVPLDKDDVVLDCGCGPGRVAIQLSKRVKKVICLDNSVGMMEECKKNCAAAGVTNVEYVLADWQETEIGKTIPEVDVVIQSRGGGGASTYEMLQKAARKYAVSIIWAEGAPNLPESRGKLFTGCYSEEAMEKYPELRPMQRPKGPRPGMNKQPPVMDGKLPYGAAGIRAKMQELGVECHTTTVEEGWDKLFSTKQDAYDWLIQLSRHPELVDMDRFRQNVDSFLTEKEDGWYFFLPTASDVTWFKTR